MKIPQVEFNVYDVARINKISHTIASHLIWQWYKEGMIKQASSQTWEAT